MRIMGTLGDDILRGSGQNDMMWGDSGNDVIYGFSGHDRLFGRDGNDTIVGGEGRDQMSGGNGNDSYYIDNAKDTVTEYYGGGYDTVYLGSDWNAPRYVDKFVLTKSGVELVANLDDNLILGTNGHDYINAMCGKDVIYGNGGNDTIWGGHGADTIYGGEGNDLIYAGSGSDYANGGPGNDIIWGGNGYNIIEGYTGNDHLIGGPVNDVFLEKGTNFGSDLIDDTTGRNDTIVVDSYNQSQVKFRAFDADHDHHVEDLKIFLPNNNKITVKDYFDGNGGLHPGHGFVETMHFADGYANFNEIIHHLS